MVNIQEQALSKRGLANKVDKLFVSRWSPRAMKEESIPQETLLTLFEALRWAPSCFNEQPWRVLYALRGTKTFDQFLSILVEFNQSWVKNAALILVFISKKTFDKNGKPNETHAFDCGAAWENLALQGSIKGLVVHGMGGFDAAKARSELKIPADYTVCAMAAVGVPAPAATLPKELADKEVPSGRKELEEIICEGAFQWSA